MSKYEHINQDSYDFLWGVNGMDYLFTSIWYHANYQKRDFIIASFNKEHNFFISKKERARLSSYGITFFTNKFSNYKKEINKQLKISEGYFRKIKNKKIDKLTDRQLASDYYKLARYIQNIWKQYFWTEYFLLDRVTEIVEKNDCKYEVEKIKKNLKEMAKLKFEQRKYLNKTFYEPWLLSKYNKEINKRLKLGKNIGDYSFKDLVKILKGEKIKKYDKKYFLIGKVIDNGELLESRAEKIVKRLTRVNKQVKTLKGQIGNKGYCRGVIKLIKFSSKTNYYDEINKMKKGQILVSGSTGPEMIMACKKAGAIITDVGGITSHAALISRELGIPSVIATKIATKVLKDGDLVEVDADKGIIKIIKK